MKYLYIFLVYPVCLFSQSEFVDSNYFGANVGVGYTANNNIDGIEGFLGFSISGLYDFGWEYLSSSIHNMPFENENSSILIYAAYNIKRKNNRSNLKILAGYSNNSLSDIGGPVVGLNFSFRVYDGEKFILMPSLRLLYGIFFSSEGGRKMSNYVNVRSLGVDFNIIPWLIESLHLIIPPSLSKDLLNSENSLI